MAWKQVRAFDPAKGGTVKYYCLKNVRLGYTIPAKWPDAKTAWDNTEQHRDRSFPAGCAVPVYYDWVGTIKDENGKPVTKNYGHIAVRMPDGRIWTDGRYYANVDELSANYLKGSKYLGWGESVNEVRVVENIIEPPSGGGSSMASLVKDNIGPARIGYSNILGRDWAKSHNGSFDAEILKNYGTMSYPDFYQKLWTSQEAANYQRKLADNAANAAKVPALQTEVANLGKQVSDLKAEIEKLKANPPATTPGTGIPQSVLDMIKENNDILKGIKNL